MKSASLELIARLASPTTSVAWLVKFTRTDAQVFGYTTLDAALLVAGVVYKANGAFKPSSIQSKSDLSVDNLSIDGILSSVDGDDITAEDIASGLWDNARIDVYVCDWKHPEYGAMQILRGTLGDVTMSGNQYTVDVRAMAEQLQKTRGRICSPQCDAILGDSRCGVNLAPFTVTGTVNATDGREMVHNTETTGKIPNYWKNGVLTWITGNNAGWKVEVRDSADDRIHLWENAPRTISVGDTFSVYPGCSHEIDVVLGCPKFGPGSALRFRGYPDVPGLDAIVKYGNATG